MKELSSSKKLLLPGGQKTQEYCQYVEPIQASSCWLLLSSEPSLAFSSLWPLTQPDLWEMILKHDPKTHCCLTTCPCAMLVSAQLFEKKWLHCGSLPLKLYHCWVKLSRYVLTACWLIGSIFLKYWLTSLLWGQWTLSSGPSTLYSNFS